MPNINTWLLENRVIYARPYGVITLEEIIQSNQETIEFIRQGAANGSSQVHFFTDTSDVTQQPGMIETSRVLTYMQEPNLGVIVVGGVTNPALNFLVKVVNQVTKQKAHTFPLPEQALQFLMEKDHSLPDLIDIFHKLPKQGE